METIKSYLDNMFMGLPKTKELENLKEELLSSMEDKYMELKAQGKSENEAIGIVILEFGNIEELTAELNISIKKEDSPNLPEVTEETVNKFMKVKKRSALFIAIGVFLCIMGANALIFAASLSESNTIYPTLGIVTFIIFIAIAVALFIFFGARLGDYKYLEEDFTMAPSVKRNIEQKQANFSTPRLVFLTVGIALCILSLIAVLIPSMTSSNEFLMLRGVNILMLGVATGVFLIIYSGVIQDGYNILLKKSDYAPEKRQAEKIIEAVASVYWPVMVAAYLLWSFLSGNWGFTWIIWPIAGVTFGAIAAIIEATHKNK